MFKCQVCNTSVGPRVKPTRVIVDTRAVSYHNEFQRWNEDRNGYENVTVDSIGEEIVREIAVCPTCAQRVGSND